MTSRHIDTNKPRLRITKGRLVATLIAGGAALALTGGGVYAG